MNKPIRTLTIHFQNNLYQDEINHFRGAILQHLGQEIPIEFHNHEENGYRYNYPLIQYKRIGGKAAIFCIDKGVEMLWHITENQKYSLQIGKREELFCISNIDADRIFVQTWQDTFTYTIRKWLPLNQHNHKKYLSLERMGDRIAMLENILTANILSFAKGLGITIQEEITTSILNIESENIYRFKNTKMYGFDLHFRSNVSLPNWIGLGKGVSHGFGTVTRKRKNNEKDNKQ